MGLLICCAAPPQGGFPPVASSYPSTRSAPKYARVRTTTPPSGVSVCTESGRTRFNCGAIRFHQSTENASLFESVSILVKGGWKETRGVQRPISAEMPVSESRMASLNPFETKRKKAPQGTSSLVCDVQVADSEGFEPSRRFPAYTLSRRAPSTTRPTVRPGAVYSYCARYCKGWFASAVIRCHEPRIRLILAQRKSSE